MEIPLLHRLYFYILGFTSLVMAILGGLTIYYNVSGQRTEAMVALSLLMFLVLLSVGSLTSYFFCYWENPNQLSLEEERKARDYAVSTSGNPVLRDYMVSTSGNPVLRDYMVSTSENQSLRDYF